MIKNDIVSEISERMSIPKSKAKKIVDAFFDEIKMGLKKSERVELRGFGVFVVRNKKTGVARNPRTNEEVEIKKGKTVKFRAGKNLNF